MWLIIKQAAPGKATKKKPMGHELFEALSSHSFLLELLQEAFKA